MLCFVVVMQSLIMNSHEVFIHIHQGCFAGTGAIVRLPQCQWSKPDGYGKISQCITTTKHSKAKAVCIFLGIYCTLVNIQLSQYPTCSGVGVTKPIFSVPLFYEFFSIVKTHVRYRIWRLYLTGVAAAQLQWHLSNMNVIKRIQQTLLQDRKFWLRRN